MNLGVGLALGIGMTLLGVSQATIELFTGDYRQSGVDLYVATHGGKMIAYLPGDSPGTIKNARQKLAQIRALPGVSTALSTLQWTLRREQPGPSRRDEPSELITVVGIDGEASQVADAVVLHEGRWFRRANEIVLGRKLAFEKDLSVGSTVRLAGRDFTAVGTGRLRGQSYAGESLAFMDLQALQQRADLGDVANMILVDTREPEQTRQWILDIGRLDVHDRQQLIQQAVEANQGAIVLRWILVGLILSIAGLFVANMLAGSVTARRLEFATLRAIGIPARTVLSVVVGEATVVCCVASVLGITFSQSLGGWLNRAIAEAYGIDAIYVADARLFSVVIGLALLLGLLAGVSPAREAAGVDPVEVLREA